MPKRSYTDKQRDTFLKSFEESSSIRKAAEESGLSMYAAKALYRQLNLSKNRKCQYCGSLDMVKYGSNFISCCEKHLEDYKKDVLLKFKKTNLNKFGVENPFQNGEIKSKIKSKIFIKFGVENPSQDLGIKEKKKNTLKKNYGVETPLKNIDILKKAKIG